MRLRPAALAVGVLTLTSLLAVGCRPPEPKFNGQVIEPVTEAPELAGTNWDGEDFRLSEHRGKVSILFFGYTYCPDVCPMSLSRMKQLYGQLGEQAKDVDVVFVSVDPKRDSVEKLGQYVPNFHERFYGVRLSADQLEAVKEGFGITVQYGQPKEGPGTDSYYYVDHTGSFYIVDRSGKLRLKFPPDTTVERMLPDVQRLLAG